jgi:hypothetical protein
MKRFLIPIAVTVCLTPLAIADQLDKLADEIRPKKSEELWRTIPWCDTPEEAAKQAKQESRPILVWTTTGPPFEHC